MSAQFSEEEVAVLRRMIEAFVRVEKRAADVNKAAEQQGADKAIGEAKTVDIRPKGAETRAEGVGGPDDRLCIDGFHSWRWVRDEKTKFWERKCSRCGRVSASDPGPEGTTGV